MMADEFNFLRPEITNYKAEADADLIRIPDQFYAASGPFFGEQFICTSSGFKMSSCQWAEMGAKCVLGYKSGTFHPLQPHFGIFAKTHFSASLGGGGNCFLKRALKQSRPSIRGILLSARFCALFVAVLIVGTEELELHYRRRGRSNFQKIKIATISVRMVGGQHECGMTLAKSDIRKFAKFRLLQRNPGTSIAALSCQCG